MGKQRRRRKLKVKFRQSAALVNKKDNTRVERPDTANRRIARAEMYRDNSANFKIKIRKK